MISRYNMRKMLLVIGGTLILSVTGCQKSPDSSIVKHKEMDNLIDEAKDTEHAIVNVDEIMQDYDTYQTELRDDELNVSVYVDAEVDIPDVDSLSVMRVAQTPVTQELVDKLIALTMEGEELYDGSVLEVKTKAELEAEIAELTEKKNNLPHDVHYEVTSSEYQQQLDNLEQQYLTAPDELNWQDYKSDGKFFNMDRIPYDNEFYTWAKSLNTDGSMCYVINNADAENRKYVYAHNNPSRGNCIRYRKGEIRSHGIASVISFATDLRMIDRVNGYSGGLVWNKDENIPAELLNLHEEVNDANIVTTTITRDEAEQIADDFLSQLGIEDFYFYEGGLYNELCFVDDMGAGYKTYYILKYMRKKDGVFVTYDSEAKHEEGWNGDDYIKKDWSTECIEFRINDEGVVEFIYDAPIEIQETVVEKTALKSFDEIKSIFEQTVLVSNATGAEDERREINIDRVVLGYDRVSEEDSYDTGLLVPVWDFIGTSTLYYGDQPAGGLLPTYESILTINAIDGTVIDRCRGY